MVTCQVLSKTSRGSRPCASSARSATLTAHDYPRLLVFRAWHVLSRGMPALLNRLWTHHTPLRMHHHGLAGGAGGGGHEPLQGRLQEHVIC